jgi:octaprenyl-diphosphate synthase
MKLPSIKLDSITSLVEDDLRQVELMLREGMRSISTLIPEVGEHAFSSGGKRIRPLLVLLAARLCGYRGPRAIQIATAVEILHTATLLHDDVVDGAELRRGRPSVNALWGHRIAILVGDFLYARASMTVVEDGDSDILWMFANTIREMSEGEVLQLERSFDPELLESTYLDIIGRKTARLLATATEAGSILGGVTRAERRAIRDYGWQLGLAFQLVDDALDYTGGGQALGKAPLADLTEGKVTMPLTRTLKRCTVAEAEAATGAVKELSASRLRAEKPDPQAVERVVDLVRRYRGAELTLGQARASADRARARIEAFVDCDAKQALCQLAEFVVSRAH